MCLTDAIVDVVFEGKDDHPFTAVRFDVGEEPPAALSGGCVFSP